MTGSCFHREHRASGMLYELIDDHFIIVILTVFEAGKRTYTDDVTITSHHRDGFQQMFRFVTVHDDAAFGFQFPGPLIDVQYNYVHTQVESSFLGAETGAEAGVKEDHQ